MAASHDSLRRALRVGTPLAWLVVILAARAGVPAPGRLLAPLTEFLASLVQALVGWAGIDALRHDALVYVPGAFAYEVGIGCTGLLPAAVVAVAIVSSPEGARDAPRRWGLLVGVPLVLLVNLLRLAHLFYLGVRSPRWFAPAHTVLWEVAIVAVTAAVWVTWARWTGRAGAAD